ncbi:hypothetical protein CBR_g51944 [Chara braunii]|uniref:Uncharacterized protein n=1 Tax=Chara braunii TaxID=69332 RepID=A0A388K6G0_CHABU|nr:hypothetical protein CBR_g51944 [Chara braunii]|eukprot:GBG65644.1 hypothetical protein CBR_g51944 [Chara braunii]
MRTMERDCAPCGSLSSVLGGSEEHERPPLTSTMWTGWPSSADHSQGESKRMQAQPRSSFVCSQQAQQQEHCRQQYQQQHRPQRWKQLQQEDEDNVFLSLESMSLGSSSQLLSPWWPWSSCLVLLLSCLSALVRFQLSPCLLRSLARRCCIVAFIMLGAVVVSSVAGELPARDYGSCSTMVNSWVERQIAVMRERESVVSPDRNYPWKIKDLLFFLHVPRTGGRSYHHCFLKPMFTPLERCPRSYDMLRLNLGQPRCHLLSSHDDYSLVTEKLGTIQTTITTNLREPVDRVLSAYEFILEVASRVLPMGEAQWKEAERNRTIAKAMATKKKTSVGPVKDQVSTMDVWPWSRLVPFMLGDLWPRVQLRPQLYMRKQAIVQPQPLNLSQLPPPPPQQHPFWLAPSPPGFPMYNNSLVMPLSEFVDHPIVSDLLHNGATFQVAGLTSNSYDQEAQDIRACISLFPILGESVLDLAKRRLKSMPFVGLTEHHEESAIMLATTLGRYMTGRGGGNLQGVAQPPSKRYSDAVARTLAILRKSKQPRDRAGILAMSAFLQNFQTSFPNESRLLQVYRTCVADQKEKYITRRGAAFRNLWPIWFSKETRMQIAADALERVRTLNHLDMKLHAYAQELFNQSRAKLAAVLHGKVEVQSTVAEGQEGAPPLELPMAGSIVNDNGDATLSPGRTGMTEEVSSITHGSILNDDGDSTLSPRRMGMTEEVSSITHGILPPQKVLNRESGPSKTDQVAPEMGSENSTPVVRRYLLDPARRFQQNPGGLLHNSDRKDPKIQEAADRTIAASLMREEAVAPAHHQGLLRMSGLVGIVILGLSVASVMLAVVNFGFGKSVRAPGRMIVFLPGRPRRRPSSASALSWWHMCFWACFVLISRPWRLLHQQGRKWQCRLNALETREALAIDSPHPKPKGN